LPSLLEIERSIDDLLAAHEDTLDSVEDSAEREAVEARFVEMLNEVAQAEIDKIDAYGYAMDKIETEAGRLDKLIRNLNERKKAVNNRGKRIEEMLKFVFDFSGRKKIEGNMYIARTRNSEAVKVLDESAIPEDFIRVKVTKEPNKEAIKGAIKKGETVPGAEIETRMNVSIGSR